jgi:hypothetical protein
LSSGSGSLLFYKKVDKRSPSDRRWKALSYPGFLHDVSVHWTWANYRHCHVVAPNFRTQCAEVSLERNVYIKFYIVYLV